MQEAPATTATTETAGPGFPPFKPDSFPSQIFWLVITMALLFVVMWRFAGPRIDATLSNRRAIIHKDIETAQENKRKAEQATVAYETPLFEARERARAMNNEYRDKAAADVKKAEAEADASAEKVTAEAEARLAKIRAEAKSHIVQAAQDATVEIVSRLTGQEISAEDAAAAVRATQEVLTMMELLNPAEPDFWEMLGLVIVIGLILWQGVPAMIGKMLDARATAIQNELTQAKQLREEAEAVLVRYTERASHAQAEAQTILTQAKQEAERFAKESEAQLKALVERRARQAQDRIARAEAQAMLEIRSMAADAAASAAAAIIAKRLDENQASALIDGSIKDLGGKLN